MNSLLTFEQPLHERIRLLLRLEALAQRFTDAFDSACVFGHHEALVSLIDIYALVTRVDIKRELMGEIERQTASLNRMRRQSGVDPERLEEILEIQTRLHSALEGQTGALDHQVRSSEFFNSVRQRMALPGGAFEFDLPLYHYWQSRPVETRAALLQEWFTPLSVVTEATLHVLSYTRRSGQSETLVAEDGYFERALSSQQAWKLIRVSLDPELGCYPEISAGRQRFTVRFFSVEDFRTRPAPVHEEVPFRLCCCAT